MYNNCKSLNLCLGSLLKFKIGGGGGGVDGTYSREDAYLKLIINNYYCRIHCFHCHAI